MRVSQIISWSFIILMPSRLGTKAEPSTNALTSETESELWPIDGRPVNAYKHQDSEFGTLVKRYLRRALLPTPGNESAANSVSDSGSYFDEEEPTNNSEPLLQGASATSSYFENGYKSGAVPQRLDEEGDPDFWDIVAWLGTQLGRAIRTLFNGTCKLFRAIYAGVVYGWNSGED
eukprot:Gregarina_sp_Poly_1__4392@NODE_2372_length_2215_cov_235_758380_g1512_i0_p2_GENE_NODE_2372_length_2215_cov_235_758380_g1512_i0NODE_2372_length_2215_cov_235_758380_g1512_i0_p2_ORF_typecomplete_len175_score19_59_NODE_2372_length_2215_cov_235_758380_g1512_i015622086